MKTTFEQKAGASISEVKLDKIDRVAHPNGCDIFFTYLQGKNRGQQGHVFLPVDTPTAQNIFK